MVIKIYDLKCWILLDIGEKGLDYILSEKKKKIGNWFDRNVFYLKSSIWYLYVWRKIIYFDL